ncbi:MAG: sulfotransferase, partial [Alphaproteobacteria bacterium]|nr:sulfotransferase [Alphaproteobacteria bacterium]
AQQELGLALSAQGAWSAALGALRKAVELAPSLPSAWRALADALYALGDADEADLAYERFVLNASSDPLLREAVEALQNGRADIAESHVRLRLKFEPSDIVAARVLADICRHTGRAEEAERLLGDVIRRARSFWPAQLEYLDALFRLGRFFDARARVEQLLTGRPNDLDLMGMKALAAANLGDYDTAITTLRHLLTLNSASRDAMLQLAHLLRVTGARDEAVDIYNRVIAVDPVCGEAWLALANMKTYRFAEFEVEALKRALETKDFSEANRIDLRFALGHGLDQLGRHEEAFQSFAAANALKRMSLDFDLDAVQAEIERTCQSQNKDFFAQRHHSGVSDRAPIFIVGMPRSGSTLIEQILASHSEVEALGELRVLYRVAGDIAGGKGDTAYAAALETIDDASCTRYAQAYLADIAQLKTTERPFFVDKTPNNFLHVGLIHLLFPKATIIDVRRHPMACGFSNFVHLFGHGHEFSYRLNEIGRFYRSYVRLMDHYDCVLPGRVYRLFYEDLIADPRAQTARLLAHCGLEFEDACLSPHQTKRPILTPSAEQVRQPLRRGADDHWRHYALWLGPLADALGPVLEAYPALPSAF